MDKNRILTGILSILLVLVLIQTMEIRAMAEKVKSQDEKLLELEEITKKLAETNLTYRATGGADVALQKLKELPQMVGGC